MTTLPCQDRPDDWFVENENSPRTVRARQLCSACPIREACREVALDEGIPYGVFGGMTRRERLAWWDEHGGRPTTFDDQVRAVTDDLLFRRDVYEKWDWRADQKGDAYARNGGRRYPGDDNDTEEWAS